MEMELPMNNSDIDDTKYPIVYNLRPPLGCGHKTVSYSLWETVLQCTMSTRSTRIEVGIWGAYVLGHIIGGLSLTNPVTIAKCENGEDITIEFNPDCGKKIRFNGRDLIELLPNEPNEEYVTI